MYLKNKLGTKLRKKPIFVICFKKYKMKYLCLTLILLFGCMISLISSPVDPSMAQQAATKFAEQRFSMERQEINLTQVRTRFDDSFYIYNIGDRGFVIIAADDAYRPVIGYSNESVFQGSNMPPALEDYLNGIAENIRVLRRKGNTQATPLIAAEWESVLQYGRLISRNGGRGVDYLCQTKWDQSYPYNYCCPDDPAGSGGHAIVGCLATAMSQLMRFWAYPIQGIGSHCYDHEDYGEICADFGNTTYDWDNMPNVLNNSSSEAEKIATGTLCFHCGVTIDMGYGPDGSGGGSGPIPGAMHDYFNYTDQIQFLKRNDYDLETNDFYRWTIEYTVDEISDLIREKLKDDFGTITDLIPLERGKSGRIWKLKIVGTKKTFTIGKELEIRRALSESHLYSSAFDVEKTEKGFRLNGKGWGHGVGLCQIGAAVMGQQGYKYDAILLHYYRNAEIKRIY